ncbi:MAG: iron-siderophore ABC transporter substrate-binding protein [Actinobacteria bacterium]|nr:iron-siderophore ABC transporter substrate-binding protein [Actinomycetota bacterium]
MLHRTRLRLLTPLLALALVTAACGDSDEDAAASPRRSSGGPVPTVPAARPSTSPGAVSIAAAVAPYERFGTDAEPGQFPRVVRHALGETRVEKEPVRVVTLDTGELDAMAELDVKPVGVVDYGADGLPAYFDPAEIEGVEIVGSVQSPNLEAVARLKPDLILSSKLRHEKLYPQLSQIAPTIFAERPGVTWKQNFTLYAQAVGREKKAAATVARYQQKVAELGKTLPTPRPTVSVARVMADGNVRLYQRANFLGVLLTDLGFPRPESQNVDDFATEVSLEQLDQADADVLVFAVFDATKNTHADTIRGSGVWKGLSAVKAGKVHTVDDQTWVGGIGYHAAFTVMDQLAGFFKA